MKELISKLAGMFYRHRQVYKWRREAKEEKARLKRDNSVMQHIEGRCMVLSPHSDDEWIGCSQIIKSDNEVLLCNMNMDGGDSESLHQIRYKEISQVAAEYNRTLVTLRGNKVGELKTIIDNFNPSYIFLPHYVDWHPEHVEVMRILASTLLKMDVINNVPQIVMYQVSCPIINGINLALPMSKEECNQKWSYFKKHYPSQTHIPYKRFYYNEVINGKYVDAYAAEVYCVVGAVGWLSALEKNLPSVKQTEGLKNSLGSISSMRRYIKSEFEN